VYALLSASVEGELIMSNRTNRPGRAAVQWIALVIGIVFLLVGIAGFTPGLTSDYGEMSFAGHGSHAMLLGLFQVSVLHNIVHLAYGVAGIALSGTVGRARLFLIGGGVIYLLLWLYGLVIDLGTAANFVPLNTADNWLHFGLGVAMIVLGLVATGGRRKAVSRKPA